MVMIDLKETECGNLAYIFLCFLLPLSVLLSFENFILLPFIPECQKYVPAFLHLSTYHVSLQQCSLSSMLHYCSLCSLS